MSNGNSAAPLYLCLDQGGHSSRALIMDEQGHCRAQAARPITTRRDGSTVEHDPEQLLSTLLCSAQEAIDALEDCKSDVVAAGLATQRSSIVCWDAHSGEALSPVISWQDTRAGNWLDDYAGDWQHIHELTGLVLSPHYGVSKLVWCLENLPAVIEAYRDGRLRFGPLASFLSMRLTGSRQSFSDPANASRTLLWDRRLRNWSDELLQTFGVPGECLPKSVPSRHEWGDIQLGGRTLPLTVVTGDQSAALFAFGAPDENIVYINLGTGAFLQRALHNAVVDPGRLLASVVYQDAEHTTAVIEGTVNGAGSALSEVAGQLGISRSRLHDCAGQWLRDTADPPLFINTVAGLGSPWWQTGIKPHFAEPGKTTSEEASIAAVLESIVFMLVVNLQHIEQKAGVVDAVAATGGLASVDPLLQRLSDLSGRQIIRAHAREATAKGLAYLLAGLPEAWPELSVEKVFLPVRQKELEQRFANWLTLMPR